MQRALGCVIAAIASGCLMPNPVYLGESQGSGGSMASSTGRTGSSADSDGDVSTRGSGGASAGDSESSASSEGVSPSGTGGSTSSSTTTGADASELCPPDPSLASCLSFDADAPQDVVDESPYVNTIAIEGGSLVPSLSQQGLLFGPTTQVEVDCPDACAGGPTMTYEAWVRVDLPPAVRGGVIDNNGLIGVFIDQQLGLRCNTPGGTTVGGELSLGVWVHVACVVDGDTLEAYVDGDSVAQRTIERLDPVEEPRIAIGNDMPSFGDPLLGAVDSVRIWMVARTPEEIVEAANP